MCASASLAFGSSVRVCSGVEANEAKVAVAAAAKYSMRPVQLLSTQNQGEMLMSGTYERSTVRLIRVAQLANQACRSS